MPKKETPIIDSISSQLRPLNSPEDLVTVGIAGSTKTLANMRSKGTGPDYLKIRGSGIRYTKESILGWLSRTSVFVKQSESFLNSRTV